MLSASQMIEQPEDNTVNSLHEPSLNLSHDTLCSGKIIFFSVIYLILII